MQSLSLRNISSSEENMNIYQGPDLVLLKRKKQLKKKKATNHVPEGKYWPKWPGFYPESFALRFFLIYKQQQIRMMLNAGLYTVFKVPCGITGQALVPLLYLHQGGGLWWRAQHCQPLLRPEKRCLLLKPLVLLHKQPASHTALWDSMC